MSINFGTWISQFVLVQLLRLYGSLLRLLCVAFKAIFIYRGKEPG